MGDEGTPGTRTELPNVGDPRPAEVERSKLPMTRIVSGQDNCKCRIINVKVTK